MKTSVLAVLLFAWPCPPAGAVAGTESYLHFMQGLVFERRGEFDRAMQEYRRTLELDPEQVSVYKQALNLALHVGRTEDAARWAEFVIEKDSATAENWVLYGNVLWSRNEAEAARAAYEKALELDPAAYEAYYQLGSLWSARDQEKSISYLRKFIELRPEDAAETYYQIAVLYNMKGDHAGVRDNLIKSKEEDPYYPQPRYMLANFYELKSDTAAALAEYTELAALETRNIELLNHIGELYAGPSVNDLASGEKYFLQALALDKSDPTACFWLSIISEQRGDYKAAASYLEGSAAMKQDAGLSLRLAYYYTQAGAYRKAIALLEKAAMKWPDNNEVAYFLALGYDDTGETKKALGMLRGILQRNPDHTDARMQSGVISERENDMAAAEEHFRYLLKKDPGNANVMNYLGYSLADRGLKLEEAELLITGAVAAEPANGAFLDSLAWVRFRRGNLEGASEGIKKALEALSNDPVIWGHAGDIFAAQGKNLQAWQAWKKSWLLENPGKRGRAARRLGELEAAVGEAALPGLLLGYLEDFSPAGREFSSFARLEGRLRGKTVKLDAMLHFSPPADLRLVVMGPLMSPLWQGGVSGGEASLDGVAIDGIDPAAFNYWASLMLGELKAWFSGEYLPLRAESWDRPCFSGGGRRVCLGDALAWPEEIVNTSGEKMKFRPGDYFLRGLYLFPGAFEFTLPHVSLKLTIDREQLKFEGVNSLRPAD